MFKEIIALMVTFIMNSATLPESAPLAEPAPVVETPVAIVEEIPSTVESIPAIVVETPIATVEDTNGYTVTIAEEDGMEVVMHVVGKHLYEWEVNGDTRTLKCLYCGDQKITEYCYDGVWGYFDETGANTLWGYINDARNNTQYTIHEQGVCIGLATVDDLIEDEALMEKARLRTLEVASDFTHGQNGDECLAWGTGTPEMTMGWWEMSRDHIWAITNPDYIYGGIACFWVDSDNSGENLTPVWILEFGY